MWSDNLVYVLIVIYLLVMIVSIYEQRWAFSLYWFASALINLAVLWGMK